MTNPAAVDLEDRPRPACENRLDLVDAAFTRPGSVQAHQLRDHYCRRCPIAPMCLTRGMAFEDGFWAGTTPNQRTDRRRELRQATIERNTA